MKRRNFVLLASAGVALASIPVVKYFFYDVPDFDKNLAVPQSLSLIWDDVIIRAVGAKYREKFPEESSERALARVLFGEAANRSHDKLAEIIHQDFVSGKTVIIDGWVLSKTEARQCALHYVLTQEKI